MLKKRIIPKLLCVEKIFGIQSKIVLVNTRNFNDMRVIGDPISQAKIFESQICDELIVLDIRHEKNGLNKGFLETVRRLASETFMPLTIGGCVKEEDDFIQLLNSGADKVSLNFQALITPELITKAANKFGSQCVVVSIDHAKDENGVNCIFDYSRRYISKRCPVVWAKEAVERGAGEILLTDVDRDGGCAGLNLELCEKVAQEVPVPVVISGGAGLAQHFVDGFSIGKAAGVAAGTFFAKRDQGPMQVRAHVANAKIPIRMGF